DCAGDTMSLHTAAEKMAGPTRSALFPYTTLFRSAPEDRAAAGREDDDGRAARDDAGHRDRVVARGVHEHEPALGDRLGVLVDGADRKSTRLHSSHVQISYAVLCLKKKPRYKTKLN